MDSKRRMVEIHIWDQPFYTELDQTGKLFFWLFICKCDNIGVYCHNAKLAKFHCEQEVDLDLFISTINSDLFRIEKLSEGTFWIKNFIRDTWGTLSAKNNLGLSCYKQLVNRGLLNRFVSEYPNQINLASFRTAVIEGKINLPLPDENICSGDFETFEGQARPRAVTAKGAINNSNNRNTSSNTSTNINTSDFSIATTVLENYPKKCEGVDIEALSLIEGVIKILREIGNVDPLTYLCNRINELPKERVPTPEAFFENLLEIEASRH